VAQQALLAGHGPTNASLSLTLAGDETVRRLNRDYRGLDETTDVLAFAFHHSGHYEGEGDPPVIPENVPFVTAPQGENLLGEVIISYPQCVRQAQSEGRGADEELALLVTHGVLHILGYDHLTPDEERVMREREAAALSGAGLHRGQP
jgi:probable rRNA maturation factor